MVKQLIKEVLAEELKTRIALALEAKMDHSDMDDEDENDDLEESFNLDIGTKVAMKKGGKNIYGKVVGKETVMGKPGVEVKWDDGVKGRFKMSDFAGLSMDRKADYIISENLEEAQDTWRVTISGMGGATVQGANRNQAVDRALSKMKVGKAFRSPYISGVRKKDVKVEKV